MVGTSSQLKTRKGERSSLKTSSKLKRKSMPKATLPVTDYSTSYNVVRKNKMIMTP
jgi:hypothetical protein